jgi:hypothetical protein
MQYGAGPTMKHFILLVWIVADGRCGPFFRILLHVSRLPVEIAESLVVSSDESTSTGTGTSSWNLGLNGFTVCCACCFMICLVMRNAKSGYVSQYVGRHAKREVRICFTIWWPSCETRSQDMFHNMFHDMFMFCLCPEMSIHDITISRNVSRYVCVLVRTQTGIRATKRKH